MDVRGFPASLTNVSWTCAGSGGGACTAAGTGAINDPVNLPAGATVSLPATGSTAARRIAPWALAFLVLGGFGTVVAARRTTRER